MTCNAWAGGGASRRTLTNPEINIRIEKRAVEVRAMAARSAARGRGQHNEIGHVQRSIRDALSRSDGLAPLEIVVACKIRVADVIYPVASLLVRGEIEMLPTGRWRAVRLKKGRAA